MHPLTQHTHHSNSGSRKPHRAQVIDPEEEEIQRQIDSETDANTEFNASRLSLDIRPRSISLGKDGSSKSRPKEKQTNKKTEGKSRRTAKKSVRLDSDTTPEDSVSGGDVPGWMSRVQGAVGLQVSKHAHNPPRRSLHHMHPAHTQLHPSANADRPGYPYAAYVPAGAPNPHESANFNPYISNPYASPVHPYAAQPGPGSYAANHYGPPSPQYPIFPGAHNGKPSNHASHLGGPPSADRRHAAELAARQKLKSNPLPELPRQGRSKHRGVPKLPSFHEAGREDKADAGEAGFGGLPGGYGHWAMPTRERSKSRTRSASMGMLPPPGGYPGHEYERAVKMSEPPLAAPSKAAKGRRRSKSRDHGELKAERLEHEQVVNLGPPLKRVSSRTKWENKIAGFFGRGRKAGSGSQQELENAIHPQGLTTPHSLNYIAAEAAHPSAPPAKNGFLPSSLGRPRRSSHTRPAAALEFPVPHLGHDDQHLRGPDIGLLPGQVPVGIPVDRFRRIIYPAPEKTASEDRVKSIKLGRKNGNEPVDGPARVDARGHRTHDDRRPSWDGRRPSFDNGRRPSFDNGRRPSFDNGRRPSFDAGHRQSAEVRRSVLERPDAYGLAAPTHHRQRSTSNTSQQQSMPRPMHSRVDSFGSMHGAGGDPYASQDRSRHHPDPYRGDVGIPPGQVPVGVHVDRFGRVVVNPSDKNHGDERVRSLRLGGRNGNEVVEGPPRIDMRGIGVR